MLSENQHYALRTLNVVFSVISLIASCTVIYCYLKFVRLRSFYLKLVFYMAIMDVCASIGDIAFTWEDDGAVCFLQGFLTTFFELASICWTCCLILTLYLTVVRDKRDHSSAEVWYHCLSWILPTVCAVVPAGYNAYKQAGSWCWIDADYQAMRLLCYYVPIWCALVFTIVAVVLITQKVRRIEKTMQNSGASHASYQIYTKLRLYPLVFVITFSWATINRIQNIVDPNNPQYWLYVLHIMFVSCQGTLNAAVYCFGNKSVRNAFLAQIRGTPPPDGQTSQTTPVLEDTEQPPMNQQ